MKQVLRFDEINMQRLPEVGGKNASLGEMAAHFTQLGIQVPDGFATTASAYRHFLKDNGIQEKISNALMNLNAGDLGALKKTSETIQQWINNAEFSKALEDEIRAAYEKLNLLPGQAVAVRSSATLEDSPDASFAGQQDTFLNIVGIENILKSVKRVYASLFSERAIAYRIDQGFQQNDVAMSVGIQKMVRSDCGASGVIFTIDTESGFSDVIFITASYGLGEAIVQGGVNPDEFYVHKPTLREGKKSIISRKLGSKKIKMIYGKSSEKPVEIAPVNTLDQNHFCLTDDEILSLATQALLIEKHYGRAMDIEWGKDGLTNELFMLQARPDTIKTHNTHQCIEQYELLEQASPITSGRSVGQKIGQGIAKIIDNPKNMDQIQKGDVLVADMTDPDWEPIMKRASAIVTNRGGRTCHAAIIARELGIPAVIGCGNAMDVIPNGKEITVSCASGESGHVYLGKLKFRNQRTEINHLPKLPVKISMNLANPEQAFMFQFLPNDGIGLMRLEFIINNMIGIHPNAILNIDQMSEKTRASIKEKTAAYKNPTEFYIEKLAEGIATIAAAFYPKQVIVRFSDFKSNEYANLLGGETFEPHEENPMIGYRGASRYISGNFQACFKLECEAIRRVREEKGLMNTHVMFPFVRTVDEAEKVIAATESGGLVRGKNGLKFIMMCEIPSNAILAETFLAHFDGYSIGSNDLTQLTLGLDRDSGLIANLFDERNSAVKALLHQIISTCKRLNKYIGICGQGPSDHPDLAAWLMEEGIENLSLTPDSILKTWLMLGAEKKGLIT